MQSLLLILLILLMSSTVFPSPLRTRHDKNDELVNPVKGASAIPGSDTGYAEWLISKVVLKSETVELDIPHCMNASQVFCWHACNHLVDM